MTEGRKLRRQKVVNGPATAFIGSCDNKTLRLVKKNMNRKGCPDRATLDANIITIFDLRCKLIDFVSIDDDSPGRDKCIAGAT
jgi:hypothetical protein